MAKFIEKLSMEMLQLSSKWVLYCCCFCAIVFAKSLIAQKPICASEYLYEDSISREIRKQIELEIAAYLDAELVDIRSEITIPVVVHIIWHKAEENISDAMVLAQIDALNRDYNLQNEDTSKIPLEFKPLAGNSGIRFCLAGTDPEGNTTTGIQRIFTPMIEIGFTDNLFSTTLGGADAWDTNKYLNIWVANIGSGIAGLGTYPLLVPPERTGVIIQSKYFGVNGHSKYGLGRTLTHEVGHYLGLHHLWGDDADCDTDDLVSDTPPQKKSYNGCPSYPQSGCSNSEMYMNFMDYVYDQCMVMFTIGQTMRMKAVVNLYRSNLLNSTIPCITPSPNDEYNLTISPNPSNGMFNFVFKKPVMKLVEIEVFNTLGQCILKEVKLVNNFLQVDLNNRANGIYYARINGETYKLMKE